MHVRSPPPFIRHAPWASLQPVLRRRPRPANAATIAGAESFYPSLVSQIGPLFRPSAEQAAALLAQPGLRVLDIGVGAAPWSLALVTREPSSIVIAVDLPAVMRSTRTAVRRAGLEYRYEFVEGSAFDVDWGEPRSYDLALIANICHLVGENANLQLLRRVTDALRAAG